MQPRPTDPAHPRSVAAGLGGALVLLVNAALQLHPSPEVAIAEGTVVAYAASLLPMGRFGA